jgi:iron-sulfur cluster assembly protein
MSIFISDVAASRIFDIRDREELPDSVPLRISVVGGGCSGLSYKIDFEREPLPPDPKRRDQFFEDKGVKIVVDMRSYLYLAGSELDYSEGLKGKGFYFRNPNATRTCSCGESFSV